MSRKWSLVNGGAHQRCRSSLFFNEYIIRNTSMSSATAAICTGRKCCQWYYFCRRLNLWQRHCSRKLGGLQHTAIKFCENWSLFSQPTWRLPPNLLQTQNLLKPQRKMRSEQNSQSCFQATILYISKPWAQGPCFNLSSDTAKTHDDSRLTGAFLVSALSWRLGFSKGATCSKSTSRTCVRTCEIAVSERVSVGNPTDLKVRTKESSMRARCLNGANNCQLAEEWKEYVYMP